jgi:hypothetical protein
MKSYRRNAKAPVIGASHPMHAGTMKKLFFTCWLAPALLLATAAQAGGMRSAAVVPPRPSVAEVLEETQQARFADIRFKQDGLPLVILAESRHFRVAAGVSPRRLAGIYFVRKATPASP